MPQHINKIAVIAIAAVILPIILASNKKITIPLDTATPQNVTLSGTYVCLPFIDTKMPTSGECVFGLKTDDGVYYMVNFGQSASAKEQFDKRAHITALGFVVPKEALNTDHWVPYNMKGIFTITKTLEPSQSTTTPPPSGGSGIAPFKSGVAGKVLLGPTCPVMRNPPDPECADKGYATTVHVFQKTRPKDSIFASVKTDKDGNFNIMLPPGEYGIEALGGKTFPTCETQFIKVEPDVVMDFNLSCDTGIR
ncbi:MAG: hypothetical protein RL641_516 [Candidatus Parcubacteria bacterium]